MLRCILLLHVKLHKAKEMESPIISNVPELPILLSVLLPAQNKYTDMEEEVYTKDEKELMDLMEVVVNYLKETTPEDEEEKIDIEELLQQSEEIKIGIMKYANDRYEDRINISELLKNRIYNYYNSMCRSCRFVSSFQPIGTQKDKYGYTFYTFKCPKCDAVFMALYPFDIRETVAFHERIIKNAAKRDRKGKIIKMKMNISEEDLNDIIKEVDVFKETLRIFQESDRKNKATEYDQSEIVKESILYFLEVKATIMDMPETDE